MRLPHSSHSLLRQKFLPRCSSTLREACIPLAPPQAKVHGPDAGELAVTPPNARLMSSFAADNRGIMAQTPPEPLSEAARGLGCSTFAVIASFSRAWSGNVYLTEISAGSTSVGLARLSSVLISGGIGLGPTRTNMPLP